MIARYLAIVSGAALALGMSASPVLAQSIHAGSSAGSYTNDFCPQVEKSLRAEFFEHTCTTSAGSGENVQRVLANPGDVALGQFDVVAAAADENPGKLHMVNPGIGMECLYAVTSDRNVDRLSGLSPRMPVALPPELSGSTATFKFLQTLDEGLAQLRNVTYQDSAMAAVEAVANGNAALAFFVQFPNTRNEIFQKINDNDNLRFVPVINRQILRREVSGMTVYQPQEVVVTPASLMGRFTGRAPEPLITTCMPVVLFTGDPALFPEGSNERQDQLDIIERLAATEPPTGGHWSDTLRNAVSASRDRVDALLARD